MRTATRTRTRTHTRTRTSRRGLVCDIYDTASRSSDTVVLLRVLVIVLVRILAWLLYQREYAYYTRPKPALERGSGLR